MGSQLKLERNCAICLSLVMGKWWNWAPIAAFVNANRVHAIIATSWMFVFGGKI
jgi:hypothetical protein